MAKLLIKDFGWNRIQKELRLIDNSYTKIGFPENANVKPPIKKVKGQKISTSMSEIAQIAAFNEWGTEAGRSKRSGGSILNIPPRPFMSTSFDENLKGINSLRNKLWDQIILGQISTRKALKILGEYMTDKTKRKIKTLREPPNALSTIKKKKSSNPLIDKGQMINSVTHTETVR